MNSPKFLLASGLTIFLIASGASAQSAPTEEEAASAPSETAVRKGADLLTGIKETDAELLSISSQINGAEGEDLVILRSRFSELSPQQVADLAAVLDLVEERRKAGADVTYLTQQIETLLSRSSRRLRTYIDQLSEDLKSEGSRRDELAAEEVSEFEHRMAVDTDRLDHLFLELITLTSEMEAGNYPVEDERDFLESRLSARGERLLKLVDVTQKQLEESREAARRSPDDQQVQAALFGREERYDFNKASLLATIHMLRVLNLDYVDLEVRAVELTGELNPEALQVEVATGLIQRELQRAETYLVENGTGLLVRLLVILAILLSFWLLARLARALVSKALQRSEVASSRLLKEMMVSLSGRIVLFIGLILALSQLGINLGPLLAGLGIVGLVIGFALQDSLSNFAAGAMILAYRPFDVGDLVETAGVLGKVVDMNLVSTRVLTPDNQRLVIPNNKIWGDVIRNVTAESRRRVDLVFGIAYEDEIPKAERLLAQIVSEHAMVLDDPKPVIKLHTLNDSSVDFVVRPWVRTEDYWEVYWDLTREVKMRFDDAGISIPYPQRDVHLIGAGADQDR